MKIIDRPVAYQIESSLREKKILKKKKERKTIK